MFDSVDGFECCCKVKYQKRENSVSRKVFSISLKKKEKDMLILVECFAN